MGSSRKSQRTDPLEAADRFLSTVAGLRGMRVAAAVSGGIDSVVLLHVLRALARKRGFDLLAVHVHHGLSPNADRWARFVARTCRQLGVPLATRRVKVARRGKGPEAAAREARYAAFAKLPVDAIALGHHLDDQAETVLFRLLRGAGVRGASGMRAVTEWRQRAGPRRLLRPFLDVPREAIAVYARAHELQWIDDESNLDDAIARNFIRLRVAPLLAQRFPGWRRALARAAGHFADAERTLVRAAADAQRLTATRLRAVDLPAARLLLRSYLATHGLRAPGARKLDEMLRQIVEAAPDANVEIAHDGHAVRVYRGAVKLSPPRPAARIEPIKWRGERRLALPALGGELRFKRVRGEGIDPKRLVGRDLTVRLRVGGERLRPDAARPRRTLKNLFQEAGIPPWERDRVPLLFCDDALAWVSGLGVDASYRADASAMGLLPQWRTFDRP
jgi:tRNA(Ile)-lysidine synthase